MARCEPAFVVHIPHRAMQKKSSSLGIASERRADWFFILDNLSSTHDPVCKSQGNCLAAPEAITAVVAEVAIA